MQETGGEERKADGNPSVSDMKNEDGGPGCSLPSSPSQQAGGLAYGCEGASYGCRLGDRGQHLGAKTDQRRDRRGNFDNVPRSHGRRLLGSAEIGRGQAWHDATGENDEEA